MSTLELRVDKFLEPDEHTADPAPQVFARIQAIDPASGLGVRGRAERREAVPISERETRALEVKPGTYFVQVTLPSGEILADRVDVPPDGSATLVLQADRSPHEWLSWQHLLGSVQQLLSAQGLGAPAGLATAGARSPATRGARTRGFTRFAAAQPAGVWFLRQPLAALHGGDAGDAWIALGDAMESRGGALTFLEDGGGRLALPRGPGDEHRTVYRFVNRSVPAQSGAVAVDSDQRRDFVAVERDDAVELLSLPVPWIRFRDHREAVIEVTVQPVVKPWEFATSVTVRDDQLAVLLGFLASGALEAVREIAEAAQQMLFYKLDNPLAAAAGAYALITTAQDARKHPWYTWVWNLYHRFEHLPDGALQVAQLRLRTASKPDLREVAALLKEAYRRGIPFYSLGVRWLLDGLEKIAAWDPEAEKMRRAVQRVALRIHPQSPFTIVRLGDEECSRSRCSPPGRAIASGSVTGAKRPRGSSSSTAAGRRRSSR